MKDFLIKAWNVSWWIGENILWPLIMFMMILTWWVVKIIIIVALFPLWFPLLLVLIHFGMENTSQAILLLLLFGKLEVKHEEED